MTKGEKFTCANCGQTFVTHWTDEEAEAEQLDAFGPIAPEERAVVCDDCYGRIMAKLAQKPRPS